jgi:predicted dehydrogenase
VLWDASHELDLLVWLFGPDWSVEGSVMARRSTLEIDTDDVAIALLRRGDGLPALVSLDYVSRQYRRGLEVVGERATVTLDWSAGVIRIASAGGADTEDATASVQESYRAQAAAFLALVRGEARPVVPAAEAAATVRLGSAIRKAAGWPDGPG